MPCDPPVRASSLHGAVSSSSKRAVPSFKVSIHIQVARRRLNLAEPAFQPPPFSPGYVDKPQNVVKSLVAASYPALCHTFRQPPAQDPPAVTSQDPRPLNVMIELHGLSLTDA